MWRDEKSTAQVEPLLLVIQNHNNELMRHNPLNKKLLSNGTSLQSSTEDFLNAVNGDTRNFLPFHKLSEIIGKQVVLARAAAAKSKDSQTSEKILQLADKMKSLTTQIALACEEIRKDPTQPELHTKFSDALKHL